MRVSLLNINRDYSNVGAVFAKCLQSVGVDAESFEYCSPERVKIEVATSDVILWMQSIPSGMVTPLKSKKVAVFHGGSLYRLKSAKMNKYWNPIVDVTLTQTAEMLGRGAKNEKWMLPAAYVENVTPRYTINKKLVVGHYPSIVYKKGRVDYITMIAYTQEASLMITDSGGIQVETSVLGIPCLTVRGATEQVHTLKEGTNKLITPDTICDEAYEVLNGNWEAPSIYNRDSGKASENIITILEEMYNE